MRALGVHIALLGASLAGSCRHPPPPSAGVPDRDEAIAATSAFRRDWLEPAHIAPPTITLETKSATQGSLTVSATPAFPEDAAWNDWPGPEARLFNNRGGLMFEITATCGSSLRWVPERTLVRLNRDAYDVPAAATPDELLVPLLGAALQAERHLVDSDLVDRTRAAGPFRAAYLATAPGAPPLAGVVLFPLPDPDGQIVDITLTIGFDTADGAQDLTLRWQ